MVGGVGIIRLCASVLEFHFPTVAVVVAVVAAVAVDYFFFFMGTGLKIETQQTQMKEEEEEEEEEEGNSGADGFTDLTRVCVCRRDIRPVQSITTED